MNILYVDESGDDGFDKNNIYNSGSPSKYFIRTGLVIHDWKWRSINQKVNEFKVKWNLPSNLELHATEIRRGKKRVKGKIVTNEFGLMYPSFKDRVKILKDCCELISQIEEITLIFVVIDKRKIDTTHINFREMPKEKSWEFLIERYNLFLESAKDKTGIIISDAIQEKIESIHRDFARALFHNSTHIKEYHFVESILFEPSDSSNLLQLVDIASYACFRYYNSDDNSLFDLINKKILIGSSGEIDGAGLKVWPI